VGFGCITFCEGVAGTPGSAWLDCASGADGVVTLQPALFNGVNCDGGIYGGISGSQFAVDVPPCSAEGGYVTTVCAANYEPASLSSGVRLTTYMDSSTCLSNPFGYADTYNYGPTSYTCKDGNVELIDAAQEPPVVSVFQAITCAASPPASNMSTSVGYGCISAMPSLTQRTFLEWDMVQTVEGLSAAALDNANNVIALVTALAKVYAVDYGVITGVNIVTSDANHVRSRALAGSVDVQFSIMGQPGFGNAYNMTDMYADMVALHQAAVAANCSTAPTGCLYTLYKALATSLAVPASLQATGLGAVQATAPQTVVNPTYPSPDTSSNTAAPSAESTGLGGGAVFGIVAGVLVVLAAGYYYYQSDKGGAAHASRNDEYTMTDSDGGVPNPMSRGKY